MAEKVDPNFTPVKPSAATLATAKANAAPGQTAEQYLASRGGVNAAGYYGDSWSAERNLTDTEYSKVLADAKAAGKTGAALGAAINAATMAKQGITEPDTTIVNPPASVIVPQGVDSQTRTLIESLQKQISDLTKQVTNTTTANAAAVEQKAFEERQRKENALTSLTARFSKYGLESLVPKIRELVINGSTESTIAFELQETEEYKQRFKANTARLAKGLAVLDAGTYIGMEDSYRQALRAYGLKQFDTDDYVSQFIANDISANELSNRIVTAVQRVQNADPAITSQLREFYNIGQNDLVAYVLDPNQQFQKIERQVQAAEIGVAAARQGITAGVQVAEQLAAQGVTQAEAQKGYATIADILPDAKKLSDIYGTTLEGYDLGQAEQEVFNQLASAQRRRQKLTQREIAAFGGSSGTNRTSLTTSSVGQI
jgi:L-lactate utilization protein LutC